jgi:hypothetical protein
MEVTSMKRVFRAEDKAQVNGLRLLSGNDAFDIEFYDESVRTAIDSTNATYVRSKDKSNVGYGLFGEQTHPHQPMGDLGVGGKH